MKRQLTIGQVAVALGVNEWKIVALFRRKLFPEPARVGRIRVISEDQVPVVKAALVKHGYLPREEAKPGAAVAAK
jgi:hypothetical protein